MEKQATSSKEEKNEESEILSGPEFASGSDQDAAMTTEMEEALLHSPKQQAIKNSGGEMSQPGTSTEGSKGTHQQKEYFTGASRRRISAMVKSGMPYEEAKKAERERYTQWKLEQLTVNPGPMEKSKRPRSDGSTPDGPTKKKPQYEKRTTTTITTGESSGLTQRWRVLHLPPKRMH